MRPRKRQTVCEFWSKKKTDSSEAFFWHSRHSFIFFLFCVPLSFSLKHNTYLLWSKRWNKLGEHTLTHTTEQYGGLKMTKETNKRGNKAEPYSRHPRSDQQICLTRVCPFCWIQICGEAAPQAQMESEEREEEGESLKVGVKCWRREKDRAGRRWWRAWWHSCGKRKLVDVGSETRESKWQKEEEFTLWNHQMWRTNERCLFSLFWR